MSEQCTYSQDMAADSLPISSLDTRQLSLLSGMPTPAKSSEKEHLTDGSQACQCGKGTLDCSIHPSTPEAWTLSMRASLARILASPEIRRGLALKREAVCTVKSSESLAWFDPESCSLKTSQQSLLTDSQPSLLTLPRSGLMRNGYVFELPIVGRRTIGTGGSYLPTPTVTSGAQVAWDKTPGQTGGTTLGGWVKYWPTVSTRGFVNDGDLIGLAKMADTWEEFSQMAYRAAASKKERYWPTPKAHDAKDTNAPSEANRNTPKLDSAVGGKLNPSWVEWLMMFPIGFTVLKAWATRKSRSKPQLPTES